MRALALLPLLVAASCGYTWGARATAERTAQGTLPRVAVLPFDNETFRRDLEIRLTRLVADEIRARSPDSPGTPEEADWLLTGTIVSADERVLSEDRDDLVRESSFVIAVRVEVRERASDKLIRTYPLEEQEPFSSRAGRIATVQQAQEQALRDLAEKIAYRLEADAPGKTHDRR